MIFKRLFIILISLFYCSVSSGQTKTENLLTKINATGADSNTIELLIKEGMKYQDSSPDSSIFYINIALGAAKKANDYKLIAKCENLLGIAYANKSIYFKSTESFIRALKMYEKLNDLNSMFGTYINLGNINSQQHSYNKALEYYFKALKIYQKLNDKTDQEPLAACYLNIGIAYNDMKAYNEAFKYNNKALKIYEKTGNKNGIAFCYICIGMSYSGYSPPSAIQTKNSEYYKIETNYFLKALEIFEETNNVAGIANAYINLSDLNIRLGNYKQAIDYSYKAETIAKKIGSLLLLNVAYHNSSISYDSLHNYQKSLIYYKLFKQTNDSIFNLEKSKQINELQLKYESNKKEKEIDNQNARITLLEQVKKTDSLKKNILTGGILSIIIISLILVTGLRRRITLNKQLYENKKLLTETELENEKLKSINLQKELEFKDSQIEYKNKELEYKNQELVNFALNIAEKNEFLENLKLMLSNSGEKVQLKKINQIITLTLINLDKERKELETRIELINQTFYMKLREIMPEITTAEERLCALIRLKLSSKEIALALNISSHSVDVYRYRLRKKFNLNKEVNLNDFLDSL